jgi:trimethylamine--corrinoid protein Co-methyltransferase
MVYGSLSRATLLHDVGYLESGLQSSYESIVLGDELAGYARRFLADVAVDGDALALAEIAAVGPGGSHLVTKYTRRHYRDFWTPGLLDRAVHDRWAAAGATTLGERVRAKTSHLRSAARPFSLTHEQRAGLLAMLDEANAERTRDR